MITLTRFSRQVLRRMLLLIGVGLGLVFLFHPGRFAKEYSYIEKNLISNYLVPIYNNDNFTKPLCPLVPDFINVTFDMKDLLLNHHYSNTYHGGKWKPSKCVARHKIALIIPYRDRNEHLKTFVNYMHGFLQLQMIDYQIFVVEQSKKLRFNRGLLFNIGYVEVLKRQQMPCFIFSDVDLLPENLWNIYGCTSVPRHMSSSVNTLRYKLPYLTLFGGVVSFLQPQFHMINGFPNRYFGWGGEDDDLYQRLINKGLSMIRFDPDVSRYYMLSHVRDSVVSENLIHLYQATDNQDSDGLNNVKETYNIIKIQEKQLYTLIQVDLISNQNKN